MNEYLQIVLTATVTGLGTGLGMAIGTYFANKALIQNLEKIAKTINKATDKEDQSNA
jgi:predicted choloylglycine hydrolase